MIFPWIAFALISFIILKSITSLIRGEGIYSKMKLKESRFSTEIFYMLLLVYVIVIIGFGLIYFILSLHFNILIEYGESHKGVLGTLIHSLYFSGVTLLTIGYGDIVPIGIGRLIAVVQALFGYTIPTAFVIRLFTEKRRKYY